MAQRFSLIDKIKKRKGTKKQGNKHFLCFNIILNVDHATLTLRKTPIWKLTIRACFHYHMCDVRRESDMGMTYDFGILKKKKEWKPDNNSALRLHNADLSNP